MPVLATKSREGRIDTIAREPELQDCENYEENPENLPEEHGSKWSWAKLF